MCLKAALIGLEHDCHSLNHRPLPVGLEEDLFWQLIRHCRHHNSFCTAWLCSLGRCTAPAPCLLFGTLNVSAFFKAGFFLSITEQSSSARHRRKPRAIFTWFLKTCLMLSFPPREQCGHPWVKEQCPCGHTVGGIFHKPVEGFAEVDT